MPVNVPAVTDVTRTRRLIELLWRHERPQPVRPGPRPRVTVDMVVTAAIARADADGLDSVTIRQIAADIGVRPMTLYSHVPDKEALVTLMIDQCLVDMPPSAAPSPDRRDVLSAVIDGNYRWYLAHPWLIEAHTEQPPPGPGVIGKYERELAVIIPLGLSDVTTDAVLTFVLDYARAAAADTIRSRRAEQTNEQWWEAVGPVLTEMLDPSRFPLAHRIGSAAGARIGGAYDAEHSYRFGVPRILDAVDTLINGEFPDQVE
ncbi:TetR family transcriptional regulator [Stackebrandtia endophytica]|uniref:TetR family transcriptional regulator n=1 Tax=Stackebrandtia endophytica TaxID=1496996 RepID=A0A543B2A8_9ACTN|nr:TetR/AcrR family transcriptional regulator [Stackebrandtia endophytica]TQL78967.1 TetR family transcriptional regulator [Stackebrandtia endophytica]